MKSIRFICIYFLIAILFIPIRLYPNDLLSCKERAYLSTKGTVNIIGDTKYPPFYFKKSNGEIGGITPELLRWIEVELNLKISFYHNDLSKAMKSVLIGKNDVMCDLFYNQKRDSSFDFTEPLYRVDAYLYVIKERTDIHSIRDLTGKTVAIQKGDYAIDFLKRHKINCKIIETADFNEAIDALIHRYADAIIGDEPVIMYYAYKNGIRNKIKRIGNPLYTGKSCLAVKNGNTELLGILNKGIKYAEKKGIINLLNTKWLGKPLNNYNRENIIIRYAPVIISVFVILLIVTFIVWLWNFRLTKELNKKTAQLRKSYGKLRDYKERMEKVLNNVNGYIFWGRVNENHLIVDRKYSKNVEKITGYAMEEFKNGDEKFWKKLLYPDDYKRIKKAYSDIAVYGKEMNAEYRIITNKDGNIKWLSENLVRVRDKTTGEEFVQGICVDITKNREINNLLSYQKAYFKILFENSMEAIVIVDRNNVVVDINKKFSTLLGYSRDDIIGKKYRDSKVANVIKETANNFEKYVLNDKTAKLETKERRKDGTFVGVLNIISPIIINSKVSGALVFLIDMTERNKLVDELRAEREKLLTTLRSTGEAIIVTDIEGNIELINRVITIKLGVKLEDARNEYFMELLNIPDEYTRNKLEEAFYNAVRNKEVVKLKKTLHLIGAKGNEFTVDINISPIFDRKSNITGVIIVFNDITNLALMEKSIVRAKNLESLGILAGGIAHDFNNYLTAILGNIEIAMSKTGNNSEINKLLIKVEAATNDAKNLTRQLMTFAKGNSSIRKISSMSNIIRDISSFVLRGSKSKCRINISKGLWDAEVDKVQIGNVISNLLINADQSMQDGGTIDIKAYNTVISGKENIPLNPGQYVKIDIIDEGIGIPQDVIDKIFDPYFTTKRLGSGLGLASAYSIIKNHNGFISVKSKIGRGTKFSVYIPASYGRVSKNKNKVYRETRIEANILVMDDEEMIRDVTREMLSILGYRAEFAKDGEEVISKYKKAMKENHKFDVVLLDLTIPGGMGGKETIDRLIKLDPDVKGVIVSGYSTDVVISEYKSYGFKDAIIKPFKMEELAAVLKEVLNAD